MERILYIGERKDFLNFIEAPEQQRSVWILERDRFRTDDFEVYHVQRESQLMGVEADRIEGRSSYDYTLWAMAQERVRNNGQH